VSAQGRRLAVFMRTLTFSLPLALVLPLIALAQTKWVEFSTYYPGTHFSPSKSGLSEPTAIAITSMDQWSQVWYEMHPLPHERPLTVPGYEASNPTQPEQEPVPLIDFKKFTLLMVASGRYHDAGYAIAFTSIVQDRGGATLVKVLRTSPGKECVILDVPTSPIALALIPRTDHAIVFDIAEVKVDCANHEIKRIDAPRSNDPQN
jgi:hypothetical protein